MNAHLSRRSVGALTLWLQGAVLAASAAPSLAEDLSDLMRPTNTIEIGVAHTSPSSYKFGEYNGLHRSGATPIVNVEIRGGGAYDAGNAARWQVTGSDLRLDTRNMSAEYGEQGRFRANVEYDELVHNRSDTYQTPYGGAGANALTLPGLQK